MDDSIQNFVKLLVFKLRLVFGLSFMALIMGGFSTVNAQTITLSSDNGGYEARAQLMAIERDHQLYTHAFNLIASNETTKIDEITRQITDKSLLPYLEFRMLETSEDKQKLLSWYKNNSDKFGADIIYFKLQRMGIKDISAPVFPKKRENLISFKAPKELANERAPGTTATDIAAVSQIASLFRANRDIAAINLADLQVNSGVIGKATWFGGLAAFRIGHYQDALRFFDKTANWQYGDDFTRSSGAFWAARAAAKLGNKELEDKYLKIAATTPFTFYGQLAMMRLGLWDNFTMPDAANEGKSLYDIVDANPRVKHAIELFDIGQKEIAQFELRNAWLENETKDDIAFTTIASALGFEDLSDEIARSTVFTGIAKAYPLPLDAHPRGGDFVLDRALIYAIMRQESKFNSTAVSYAGARGLMQLMPTTAAWLAGSPDYRNNPSLLHNDEINISLGENYLEYVLRLDQINNSVARALMAYNAGPGNVNKWSRNIAMSNDTLMFIEATPNTQAREYVKKVMTNLWVYHKRLGQNAPTLEKLAFDKAPDYEPQDNPRFARNAFAPAAIKTAMNKQ